MMPMVLTVVACMTMMAVTSTGIWTVKKHIADSERWTDMVRDELFVYSEASEWVSEVAGDPTMVGMDVYHEWETDSATLCVSVYVIDIGKVEIKK